MHGQRLNGVRGLILLIAAAALVPAPSAAAQDAGWQLAPDVTCLWRPCATFTPTSSREVLEQGWWAPLAIKEPGLLVFPPGYSTLKRPSTQQVLTIGPGSILYSGRSDFRAIQPLYVRYEHPGTDAAPLEITLPTVILGTEGTVFRIEPDGPTRLTVTVEKGNILYRWIDSSLRPGEPLPEGQALNTSSIEPRSFTIEQGTTRGIRPGYRSVPTSKGLPRHWPELKAQLEAELATGRPALTPEQLTLVASDFLPTWPPSEQLAAAKLIALSQSESPLAGRVIFQLWLQARQAGPGSEQARELEALLQSRFAETAWPAALEGILALDAQRAQDEGAQDEGTQDGTEGEDP